MKFKWTLYRKIQLIIAIVLILVFASSQFAVYKFVDDKFQRDFDKNILSTAKQLQKSIEIIFGDVNSGLNYIKNQYESSGRDDDFIRSYLHNLIETKDNFINAYIAYEDKTFVLEPYTEIDPSFDPTIRPWYKLASSSSEIVWNEPYEDEVTGQLVITGSLGIELADGEKGVLGIDIDLAFLSEVVETTTVGEDGYVIIVNEEDQVIVDSRQEKSQNNYFSINDPEFSGLGIITGRVTTDKGVYNLRKLNKTSLRLVAFNSNATLSGDNIMLQLSSSPVLIMAVIVGIFISYLLAKRLTKPIEELTDTMLNSLSEESLLLYQGSSGDEIDTLIEGYNTMATNVNNQRRALKTVSNRLIKSEKKLQEQYDKVADLAYYDHLTNLPNRLSFEQEVKLMIEDNKQFALYYADLDNFKYINDTYGHNYGDFVLQIISKRFKNCCDGQYFAARLSGDEFGVIVTYEDKAELDWIALTMLSLINEPIYYSELEFSVTGSIGISLYPEDGKTFEDLLANSDIAMYEAKGNSKNQYMIFDQELRSNLIDRVTIETKLLSALDNNEIYLCYQPLINFSDKSAKGFEALVRWESPSLGTVYPDVFIPIAEHNLFINKLGHYVLVESIKFGQRLYEEFGQYYEMNVNVSLIQLHIESFLDDVFDTLNKYNYPPEFLNLEITESVALESDEKIRSKLRKIRDAGIQLSLDDFGTGYSSINHLLNIQLTHLKIDRTIIIEATKEGEVHRLIQGIVDFAHAIELQVVAEGIEDEKMEEIMDKMNIDFAQGYLYSRPIRDEEAIKYIKEEVNR